MTGKESDVSVGEMKPVTGTPPGIEAINSPGNNYSIYWKGGICRWEMEIGNSHLCCDVELVDTHSGVPEFLAISRI